MILQWLENLGAHTVTALRFFSRLPIPDRFHSSIDQVPKLNDAAIGFPFAGLVIALFPAILWIVSAQFLPSLVAAILAIALATLITGALHEDGLADCADGLGGATTRERALEIMRDSTIGTYGAAALFFSLTMQIATLVSLSPWLGAMALLMAHTTSRASIVIAIATAGYARPSGLGDSVKQGTSNNQLYLTLGLAFGLCVIFAFASAKPVGILAPLAGICAAWATLQYLKSRLGGYTGDGLGAMEQMARITIMIVLAGLWS